MIEMSDKIEQKQPSETEVANRSGVIYRLNLEENKEEIEIQYLVVREVAGPRYWGFPKGLQERKEDGQLETPSETAEREVREEIGIEISQAELNAAPTITAFPGKKPSDRKYTFFLIDVAKCFECYPNALEISEYRWVTLKEFFKLPKASFTKQALKELANKAQTI
jgi:8-oxo-dGTP pyrophosphatase MutT (NUDIX family)